MSETTNQGWVKLYTASGAHVTLPVTPEPLDYGAMLKNVEAMLSAGFMVIAPGLDEGEEKQQVGWVLKGETEGRDGPCPFVLLYAVEEAMAYSFLKCYLNTREQQEAFEYASKMHLSQMPTYEGNDKPQRGAATKTDKYIRQAYKPFVVVFKHNPKRNESLTEDEKKKVPARLFVRWADVKPTGTDPQQPEGDGKTTRQQIDEAGLTMTPEQMEAFLGKKRYWDERITKAADMPALKAVGAELKEETDERVKTACRAMYRSRQAVLEQPEEKF